MIEFLSRSLKSSSKAKMSFLKILQKKIYNLAYKLSEPMQRRLSTSITLIAIFFYFQISFFFNPNFEIQQKNKHSFTNVFDTFFQLIDIIRNPYIEINIKFGIGIACNILIFLFIFWYAFTKSIWMKLLASKFCGFYYWAFFPCLIRINLAPFSCNNLFLHSFKCIQNSQFIAMQILGGINCFVTLLCGIS